MKKIILCLTIASVAFALFLVPCSAFTIAPDSYDSPGSFGTISYIITNGVYTGQEATVPIVVSARVAGVTGGQIQSYRPNNITPDGFTLARVRLDGLPGYASGSGTYPLSYHLQFAVQYTPSQLASMPGYAASLSDEQLADYVLIGLYPDGSALSSYDQIENFKVDIIRHYSDNTKGISHFTGEPHSWELTYSQTAEEPELRRAIFTDDVKAVSFVISCDVTNLRSYLLDIAVPSGYTYSTLYDDYHASLERDKIDDAYNSGYQDATDRWEEANFNLTSWLWDMIDGFLSFEIIPSVPLWSIFLAVLGVLLLRAILALVGGG